MSKNFLNSSFLRWLTFYLLLVLAILLLIVNLFPQTTQGASVGSGTPTTTLSKQQVTKTAIANATATAIATNSVSLGNSPVELHLTQIVAQDLINNTPSARTNVKNQVMRNTHLQGKHAAFVIVYVGLSNSADPTLMNEAPQVAGRIESILRQLNANNNYNVFTNAVYRPVVFIGKVTNDNQTSINETSNLSEVDLEIYLYTPQQS
jgi:hypothetical protein